MNVFHKYAALYDDYYSGKNYAGEVDYLLSMAKHHGLSQPQTILDMGCGTGGHLIPLAQKGLRVTGFDLSQEMSQRAKEKIKNLGLASNVETADVRTYRDGCKYDLVIAMFAVLGYLTSNEDFMPDLQPRKTIWQTTAFLSLMSGLVRQSYGNCRKPEYRSPSKTAYARFAWSGPN